MVSDFPLSATPIFLGNLGPAFQDLLRERHFSKMLLLVDENTRRHCLPVFLEKTGLPEDLSIMEISAGEAEKTLKTCEKVWQAMLEAQLDRNALLINLGGGMLGDLGGFCAAAWKRGIEFVQIPTTLLAMTDAAIGGKTGIDFQGVKNVLGAFRNPAAVWVDPVFLKTLPSRELRSGFAEIIKHALIGNSDLEQLLQAAADNANIDLQPLNWLEVLHHSIDVKVSVVANDPFENGQRALLNYGHTIGHALESWFLEKDADALTHGEAVAIGMICEAWLSASPDNDLLARTLRLVSVFFPHRPVPEQSFADLQRLMQQDKKNEAGTVRMVVPASLEHPFSWRKLEISPDLMEQSLRYYNGLPDHQ